ncbi:MAG: hypothetical protein AAB784_02395 [Patescibacteria group bacterium]
MATSESQPRGTIWFIIVLALLVFALSIMYFGNKNHILVDDDRIFPRPTVSRQPRVYTVFYGLGVFSPTNIRIHVGDSVRFQNDSKSLIRIVSDITNGIPDLAGFDSVGNIPPDGIFTYTFNSVGIFGYHNALKPLEEGTLIVKP